MNGTLPPVPPDVGDTPSRQGSIVALFVVMLLIATTGVALRFYTRWKILNIVGIEDWLLAAALVISSPSLTV